MRTPEEVAREVDHATKDWDPGNGASEEDLARWADLIRSRDAEVAAQARAEALAGFEWEERRELGSCTNPYHVHGVTGIPAWSSTECRHAFTAAERRLVGPWEPVP